MEIYENTKDGCDKNCLKCDMYLPSNDMCFHKAEKMWHDWNAKEHERFGKILKGES